MKQPLTLLLALMMCSSLLAQSPTQVQDKENIFTPKETHRIDSLLQAYRKNSNNLVAVYTDYYESLCALAKVFLM